MQFQFRTTLTEEDYFNFDVFYYLECSKAKKETRKHHLKIIAYMALLSIAYLIILRRRPSSIFAVAAMVSFTVLYLILYKPLRTRSLKKRMKRLMKDGKFPFEAITINKFYEDTFVDQTGSTRIEQNYSELERICIVKSHIVVLYKRSANAHILPIAQIKEQADYDDFLRFICTKCSNVENY